jgi:hypothetical protein
MPRFFAFNRLAAQGVLALGMLAVSPFVFAGGNVDVGGPIDTLPGSGGNSGGYLDDSEVDTAAIVAQCGWTGRLPRSQPFDRGGALSSGWQSLNINQFQWNRSFSHSSYRNAMCEMFLLEQVRRDANGLSKFRDRCESIREDLLSELGNDDSGQSNIGNFSASQAFFGGSSGGGSAFDGSSSQCDDADVASGNTRFACRVLTLRDIESSPNTLKDYAKKIMADCKKAGADMRRRMTQSEYNSYASSGVHYMGGMCGGVGGGVVVLQQQNKWYDTLANTALGLTKVIAPMWVMNDANKRANQTAQMALKFNKELGFPSGQYSGTGVGMGMGYGYGGGGFGYTGHGGACPFGYCGGNGGVIVGGGLYGPGAGYGYGNGVLGGTCGVPPYAPWSGAYGGCGSSVGYNGGVSGNPWLTGGAAGRYPGSVFTGGTPGFYNGAGFGATGNTFGMPGALGTLNGGNGWGGVGANMGQWGPGGTYGQTAFYGSGANPYYTQQANLMQQQMMEYAQASQRRVDQAQKSQARYGQDLDALSRTYSKSFQSYSAAQNATAGAMMMNQGYGYGSGYGYGAYGYGYGQGGYYNNGGMGGIYYPPYSSGGSNFSLGLQYNSFR